MNLFFVSCKKSLGLICYLFVIRYQDPCHYTKPSCLYCFPSSFNVYWSIVDLQYCVSFRYIAKGVIYTYAAAAAKSLQSCLTLYNSINSSLPGSPIPGILLARILECVAVSFSNAWKWKVKVKSFSRVWLLVTPSTAAHQAPPSTGFSRQEYWGGVQLPSLQLYIYIYPLFFRLFSHIGHYRLLSKVLYALQ